MNSYRTEKKLRLHYKDAFQASGDEYVTSRQNMAIRAADFHSAKHSPTVRQPCSVYTVNTAT
jgi:hypothetical protein